MQLRPHSIRHTMRCGWWGVCQSLPIGVRCRADGVCFDDTGCKRRMNSLKQVNYDDAKFDADDGQTQAATLNAISRSNHKPKAPCTSIQLGKKEQMLLYFISHHHPCSRDHLLPFPHTSHKYSLKHVNQFNH